MLQSTLSEVVHELFGNNLHSKYESLIVRQHRRYLLTTVLQLQMEQQWGLGQIFNSKLQKLPCLISLQHRVLWDVLAGCRVVVWQLCYQHWVMQESLVSVGTVVPAGLLQSSALSPWGSCARAGAGGSSSWATAGPGDPSVGEPGTPSAREIFSAINWM